MDQPSLVWIAILPAIVFAMAPLLMARKDPQREKALNDYARKVNLALTPDVRPRVIGRIRSFEKSGVVGAIVGVAVAFLLYALSGLTSHDDMWSESLPLMIIMSMAFGAAFAPTVVAVRRTLRPTPGRRLARPTTPTIADYVPTLERISSPLGLGCAALAIVVAPALFQTGLLASDNFSVWALLISPGAFLGYFGVLSWIAGIVIGRLVLRTGQVAGSEQELAWDDALRAMTLRSVAVMPFFLSIPAVILIVFDVVQRTSDMEAWMSLLGGVALLGYLAIVGGAVAVNISLAPARHYWRRLWEHRTGQPA